LRDAQELGELPLGHALVLPQLRDALSELAAEALLVLWEQKGSSKRRRAKGGGQKG